MLTSDDARPATTDSARDRKRELIAHFQTARTWFRSFRRTRPFWGGLWLIVGGWFILRLSMVSISAVIGTGVTGSGGWLTGGGCILCGLLVWVVPSQRYVAGVIGVVLAVSSLMMSNLGGLLIGMFAGIIGSGMVIGWGPKKPRGPKIAAEHEQLSVEPETVGEPA